MSTLATFRHSVIVRGWSNPPNSKNPYIFMHQDEKNSALQSFEARKKVPMVYPRARWTSGTPSKIHLFAEKNAAAIHEVLRGPTPTKAALQTHDHEPIDYKEQQVALLQFVVRCSKQEWMGSNAVPALMSILGQGLEDVVTCLPREIEVGRVSRDPINNPLMPIGVYPPDMTMTTARPTNWGSYRNKTALQAREMLSNRPLIAGMIHWNQHWGSFVFDRQQGVLFVFDPMDERSEPRFHAVCAYWREYLTTLGFPYDFLAIEWPGKTQPNAWMCGYASVAALFGMLRSRQGKRMSEYSHKAQPVSLDTIQPVTVIDRERAKEIRSRFLQSNVVSYNVMDIPVNNLRKFVMIVALNEIGCMKFSFLIPSNFSVIGTRDEARGTVAWSHQDLPFDIAKLVMPLNAEGTLTDRAHLNTTWMGAWYPLGDIGGNQYYNSIPSCPPAVPLHGPVTRLLFGEHRPALIVEWKKVPRLHTFLKHVSALSPTEVAAYDSQQAAISVGTPSVSRSSSVRFVSSNSVRGRAQSPASPRGSPAAATPQPDFESTLPVSAHSTLRSQNLRLSNYYSTSREFEGQFHASIATTIEGRRKFLRAVYDNGQGLPENEALFFRLMQNQRYHDKEFPGSEPTSLVHKSRLPEEDDHTFASVPLEGLINERFYDEARRAVTKRVLGSPSQSTGITPAVNRMGVRDRAPESPTRRR